MAGAGEFGQVQVMFTHLATRLGPPADPQAPSSGCVSGCALLILGWVAFVTAGATVKKESGAAVVLILALAGLIILGILTTKFRMADAERYSRELSEQQRNADVWRRLSYCFRDDTVFVYTNGNCVHAPSSSYESIYYRLASPDEWSESRNSSVREARSLTSPNAAAGRAALVEQRRALASRRDKALQNLLITHEYVEDGRRPETAIAAATAEAEAACEAVAAFDAVHPGIQTSGNAEDDDQAMDFMDQTTRRSSRSRAYSDPAEDSWLQPLEARPGEPPSHGRTSGAEYRMVRCDVCNTDYTDSPISGGYLSGSWAICPDCVNRNPPGENDIPCPPGISFANFVRSSD
jgi:hypothetical protein